MHVGDMWHVCLEGLKDVGSLCYGWRAEADVAWEGGSRFHPGDQTIAAGQAFLQLSSVAVKRKAKEAGRLAVSTFQVAVALSKA